MSVTYACLQDGLQLSQRQVRAVLECRAGVLQWQLQAAQLRQSSYAAIGRLSIAAAAGPVRFWLPLAGATVVAIVLGYAAFATLPHFEWPGPSTVIGS